MAAALVYVIKFQEEGSDGEIGVRAVRQRRELGKLRRLNEAGKAL